MSLRLDLYHGCCVLEALFFAWLALAGRVVRCAYVCVLGEICASFLRAWFPFIHTPCPFRAKHSINLIAQVDDCCSQNNLEKAQVSLNGGLVAAVDCKVLYLYRLSFHCNTHGRWA